MFSTRLTIVVSGMIAGDPFQGGATWAVLQYVLGLRDLGHRVLLVEPIKSSAIRPAGAPLSDSINTRYFRDVVCQYGLDESAALLMAGTRTTAGLSYERLNQIARQADLLINISGMLTDENLLDPIPVRVYLDLDPSFVQLWAAQGIDMRFGEHSHFVTIGRLIGSRDCRIPTCGKRWVPIWQPVVLKHWHTASVVHNQAFTTVGNWRGYGSIEHGGKQYGQKVHSFRQLIDLPQQLPAEFILALAIHPQEKSDLAALRGAGWQLVDPVAAAGTPAAYQKFIRQSYGEIGIAKAGYVTANCGWFSDRSVCYLASGRPVIGQDTGFSQLLPTGAGLFAFRTVTEVALAIGAIRRNYERHRRAARGLAEDWFDSRKVLTNLLEAVGGAP